tara:strand:- start:1223 stop:2866 length:1644 start_codon:yes stop_codon:yes gene_type:complete
MYKILFLFFIFFNSLDAIGLRLINPLKKIISNNNNNYYSSFFEMNLTGNIWKPFVYAQIINNISLKTKSNKVHLFVEDYFLCKSVLEISNIKTISYLKSNMSFYLFEARHLLKSIFTWIYNLSNEILTSIILKSFLNNRSNLSINKVTFAMLKLSWWIDSNKKDTINYTYTGRHFNNLKKDEFYILSLLRQNSSRLYSSLSAFKELKKIKNKNKILYIEKQGSYLDILNSYFSTISFDNAKLKSLFKKNQLEYAYNFFIINLTWIDYPKNSYLETCVDNFLKKNKKITKILIPLFEFTEGKMVLSKFNKNNINTVGLQQGAIGQSHKWRFIFATKVFKEFNKLFFPNKLFVISNIEKKLFSQLNIKNIKYIGSLRSQDIKYKFKNNKKTNVLILLDMHNWKSMLNSIHLYIKEIPNSKILIRPHPSISNINLVNYTNLEIDRNLSISKTLKLYMPDIIIAGDTGLVLDFSAAGFSILLIETNNYFSLSPLLLEKNKHEIYNIDNQIERKKLISNISQLNSIKSDNAYAKKRVYLNAKTSLKNLIRNF